MVWFTIRATSDSVLKVATFLLNFEDLQKTESLLSFSKYIFIFLRF